MAFRKKGHLIKLEQPDILIIPECEHPDRLLNLELNATSVLWYGTNRSKGLAIFSFGEYHLDLINVYDESIKIVCPISVTGGEIDFTLLAVWTQNTKDWDYRHIGQVWKAVHYYEEILSAKNVIIVGDFNSNVIWDKSHRHASHSMIVDKLADMQIHSVYHRHFSQVQGKEVHPTFFLYRHENKPYHIDYCFVSEYFMKRLMKVEVGNYQNWKAFSDHSPLIVNFSI
jgi:exodeoxyribonuclease-3